MQARKQSSQGFVGLMMAINPANDITKKQQYAYSINFTVKPPATHSFSIDHKTQRSVSGWTRAGR
jgi:hypothetical protein